jgi:hypothetical protein
MTEAKPTVPELSGSIRRALSGQTPDALCAYSFAFDADRRKILLKAHFDRTPSDVDCEDISVVETEVFSDFPDYPDISTEIELLRPGTAPSLLPGGIAYLRGVGEPE